MLLVGCGSVQTTIDGGTDAAACTDPTSVDSCGVACEPCEAPSDRATATCDGVACGLACNNGAPTCSDSTCARNRWTFGSGTIEDITGMPNSLPLAVRDHAGNPALALDVPELAAGISIALAKIVVAASTRIDRARLAIVSSLPLVEVVELA